MKAMKWLAGLTVLTATASCGNVKSNADAARTDQLPQGVTVMPIDAMTLTTLKDNEGDKRMPNKLFYGTDDSARVERLSPEGGVPSSIHCFLVENAGKTILFDTGNGAANGGLLLTRLDSLGIAPADIDLLVLTHFHNDHIGGMLRGDTAVFPRAQVYVPAEEYDFWVTNGDSTGLAARTMKAYADRLHRFAPTDSLPAGIRPLPAPGHTPGHTAYRMGRLLIVGDLMHGLALQLQAPDICPAFDMDRELAIKTRQSVLDTIRRHADEQWVVAGMHFPGNGLKTDW